MAFSDRWYDPMALRKKRSELQAFVQDASLQTLAGQLTAAGPSRVFTGVPCCLRGVESPAVTLREFPTE